MSKGEGGGKKSSRFWRVLKAFVRILAGTWNMDGKPSICFNF